MNEANGGGVGLREWCRANGVAPSTLAKALTSGRVARLADGSLDVQSAGEWLASRGTVPARPARARSGAPRKGSVAAAQRRLIEYRARLAALEYRRRSGELVGSRQVATDAFGAARRARDVLLSVPARLAVVLSPEQLAALEREIEVVLTTLSSPESYAPEKSARRSRGAEVAP